MRLVDLSPALLLVSFGIYVLIDFVPGAVTDSPALDEMPVRDRLVGLGVMATFAVPLMAVAREFISGRRRLVLFLRRFGDRGSLAMVTQAATGALPSVMVARPSDWSKVIDILNGQSNQVTGGLR